MVAGRSSHSSSLISAILRPSVGIAAQEPYRGAQEPLEARRAPTRPNNPMPRATVLWGPCRRSCGGGGGMSSKPVDKKPLAATIKEHWADKLELGGAKDGHVACYAANQL